MRDAVLFVALAASWAATACSRPPAAREYTVEGQVVAIQVTDRRVVIRHGDIKGFMPGMTMPFPVKDGNLLSAAKPGDFVTATLVVTDGDAWLSRITPTGRHEPVPADATVPRAMQPPLGEGDPVPDVALVDQAGRRFSPAMLKGRPWAVTFVYTRCPLPTFCPALERRFLAVEKAITATPALGRARLVSVSIDPGYDTPQVLAAHARALGADTSIWTFATGPRDVVDSFVQRFGVVVERGNGRPEDFVHSMRTAVIDPQGRVKKVIEGSEWTPDALLSALGDAARR